MINKGSATSLTVAAAALIISFLCPPQIVNVGLVFFDNIFNPLPHDKRVPITKEVIKEKIFSALATLSLQGQQSVLVQLWSPTKAGNTFLLYTCQTFGSSTYEIDKGLKVYHKGCLRHAFYVHRETNVSFGLPGLTFMEGTPQQTQHMHNYPKDQRPPCEDATIFSMKWGSFTVPVTLDNKCVGVLEFVFTEPTGPYDVYIEEVCKALECVGFQSSLKLDTTKRTFIAKKRKRTTQSCSYAHYNVLVPWPEVAREKIKEAFGLEKVTKNTFKKNIKEIVGITEWPYIRDTCTRASSSAPETRSNPTALEAASSIGTPDSVLTSICDEGISEQSREPTSTLIASAYEAQLYQTPLETSLVADDFNRYCGVSEMSWEQTPTIKPSALGLRESLLAYEAQLYQLPLETSPVADDINQYWDSGVSEILPWEQTPTIKPSALGLSERLHAIQRELMEEDQDDLVVHDHGRSNDMLKSFEECLPDTSGGMEIDIATSVLRFK